MYHQGKIKQVIVIRKDLKCRRGKEIAQGCHASSEFLLHKILNGKTLNEEELIWASEGHAKICVTVQTEAELIAIHEEALAAGITSNLEIDEGVTEFRGVYTKTAVAIGPDYSSKIDKITGNLPLY